MLGWRGWMSSTIKRWWQSSCLRRQSSSVWHVALTTETMGVVDNTHQTQGCLDKLCQLMVCQEVDKSLHKTTCLLQWGGWSQEMALSQKLSRTTNVTCPQKQQKPVWLNDHHQLPPKYAVVWNIYTVYGNTGSPLMGLTNSSYGKRHLLCMYVFGVHIIWERWHTRTIFISAFLLKVMTHFRRKTFPLSLSHACSWIFDSVRNALASLHSWEWCTLSCPYKSSKEKFWNS